MKQLWIASGILLVIFCSLIGNNIHLNNLVEPMTQQLDQAAQAAREDDWDRAEELLGQARDTWENRGGYLHTLLQHREIDEVLLLFQESEQYLQSRKLGEYTAVNARLITQLELICEMEELSWRNVF